jgi:uncharacterized Rossmann fold enzyme
MERDFDYIICFHDHDEEEVIKIQNQGRMVNIESHGTQIAKVGSLSRARTI